MTAWYKCSLLLVAVLYVRPSEELICPDGETYCPFDFTCCKGSDNIYACCPMEHAVCCSDHKHCCPFGFTCNLEKETCTKGSVQMAIYKHLTKKLFQQKSNRQLPLPRLSNQMCPDGRSQCPTHTTCCKLPTQGYGCCPLEKAVCCSDHKHCCPNGYICNVQTLTCVKGNSKLSATKKFPAEVLSLLCPDGISECPSGNTCCKLPTGQYGCCPLPEAVCCADHEHCCPNGYTCDVGAGTCTRGSVKVPALRHSAAKPLKAVNVICPDGQSECPSGNTCCKLASGQYGCCPLPKAVCCADHEHCCPNGYTCDVGAGTCTRGSVKVPALRHIAANPLKAVNVICPDGQSECPSGNTCCKLASGQYGCCPLPKAVCCADHEHCCPNGYTCDVGAGTCTRGSIKVPALGHIAAKPLKAVNVICPDGQSECPSGNTCCKLASGQYGCCPLPKAVCCADHEHCCPNGYTCDVGAGTCTRGSVKVPALRHIAAKPLKAVNVICPDGQSECPSGNTCCKLASGQYGCCPLPKAVCCADHEHCCPNGYTCDVGAGTCTRGSVKVPALRHSAAKPLKAVNVICPDGQSECPSGNTCCKLASGQYGCCPLPKAVCCADHEHCCPNGYTCDVGAGTCTRGSIKVPALRHSAAKPLKAVNVICPDGQSECPSCNTCCKLASGQYGCCPLPKAVCCADHEHCCPNGYTCDVGAGTCTRGSVKVPALRHSAAKPLKAVNVICPDGQSECPSGNTCCKLASGQYGCCPLPKAVCCADHEHCCPNGYTCDVGAGTCTRGSIKVPALRHIAAKPLKAVNVICPDGQSECPSGNTCCKLASGQYGCCPLPKAVCCADHEHCCPNGYTCDVGAGTCTRGSVKVPALRHSAAKPLKAVNVICPDGQSECPSGNTCCKLASGQYGCCPLPKAVCCADHEHCCPNGYTCDVGAGTCTRGSIKVPALRHIAANPLKAVNVICPDGQSECPSGNTCCKLASGQYGCCPLPKAVCCADHEHCCPNGYTCDVGAGTCTRGSVKVPALRHSAAKPLKAVNVICPDGQSECPSGNTCCKLASGQYGCCPLPKAVCCADHEHCCPNGYTCDVGAGTCTRGSVKVPALRHSAAKPLKAVNVICPDGQSECPSGNTCCKLASGQYGCCPLPKAVCCADHEHCCPNGYTCDVGAGTCTRGSVKVPALRHSAAKPLKAVNVICPDGQSECPSGNTCCKLASGQYGCCPLPKAVCCADHEHCCPNGYTCDVGAGTCTRGSVKVPALRHSAAKPLKAVNVICPDGQSECPSGNTCCKLASGQYGCCPLPKAVCCADHEHCCPNGYTCDVGAGTCTRGSVKVPALRHSAAKPLKAVNVICPDGQSECPSGNTCCKLASGQYGCCPLPKAVCCADHEHCCPNGYTCDVGAGTCTRGSIKVPALRHIAANPLKAVNVICPDGQSECPSGNTCCKLASGQYGCCPLPKAVCCADHEHCCPNGYTCDVGAGTCTRGSVKVPALRHSAAKPLKAVNVICPDGQSECPSGNTCCKLASGQYGCCPLPKAVCCADHEHCCPNGYTCDVGAGTCTRGSIKVPALRHIAANPLKAVNVICPDGQSECPSGNTCCKLASGQYGCCPLPKAVCCADHEHCCPNGYTCDVGAGTCTRGSIKVPALRHIAAKPLKAVNVICPDGQSECPSGNTCCKLASGQYGCCPLPKAVCCADHEHCCPNGYTCDVGAGTCTRGSVKVPALRHSAAKPLKAVNVICPDGQSECPSGNTCCKLASGQYGCCPLPKAVCCADHEHCCPNGYTCDVGAGTCTRGSIKVPALRHIAAKPLKAVNVICPDGQSECPSGNTCCKLASGQYGCCPLPKAVCCADHEHCCPNGYTCDVGAGTCTRGSSFVSLSRFTMLVKHVVIPVNQKGFDVSDILCAGGEYECPAGFSCCKRPDDSFSCCPYKDAVCCADKLHCCPKGYTCDAQKGQCTISHATTVLSLIKKENAMLCPGGHEQCPDGFTCCELSHGVYGCCPFENAVCCDDHVHCCPSGHICNLKKGTCDLGTRQSVKSFPLRLLDSTISASVSKAKDNVICPDQESQCPSYYTCCLLKSGMYGCCPLPNAVCCNDFEHCCPHGTVCDVQAGLCSSSHPTDSVHTADVIPMRKKVASIRRVFTEHSLNICPDHKHACPDKNTCCPGKHGEYSCCPLEKAVCCSDHFHCCPHETTCDLEHQTCVKGGSVTLARSKFPAFKLDFGKNHIASGCQKPRIACHSVDGTRCCLPSQECTATGQCVAKSTEKNNAEKYEKDIVCPDQRSRCIPGTTCCETNKGVYRCCPLPNAVCCRDNVHCCPLHWVCETDVGTCRKPKTNLRIKAYRSISPKETEGNVDYLDSGTISIRND